MILRSPRGLVRVLCLVAVVGMLPGCAKKPRAVAPIPGTGREVVALAESEPEPIEGPGEPPPAKPPPVFSADLEPPVDLPKYRYQLQPPKGYQQSDETKEDYQVCWSSETATMRVRIEPLGPDHKDLVLGSRLGDLMRLFRPTRNREPLETASERSDVPAEVNGFYFIRKRITYATPAQVVFGKDDPGSLFKVHVVGYYAHDLRDKAAIYLEAQDRSFEGKDLKLLEESLQTFRRR